MMEWRHFSVLKIFLLLVGFQKGYPQIFTDSHRLRTLAGT